MTAHALKFQIPSLSKRSVLRMIGAGTAWGVLLSAGLTALSFYGCGAICPDDVMVTTALSVGVGIVAIGPIAAFGRGS
jgi:hypothetical protein